MEQDRRLGLIDHEIQKLIHDNTNNDAQYQHALSQLKGEKILEQFEASAEPVDSVIDEETAESGGGSENDEIMKELKKLKRQNFVTQCLLSVMIVLTVAWQLSEVSLILKVKDGLSHPFRSFGNMLKGIVKVPDMNTQEADDKENPSQSQSQSQSPSLPSMIIPNGN